MKRGECERSMGHFAHLLLLIAHCVQDDIGPCKSDARAGDGDLDVSLHGIRGDDASVRWVLEHGHKRQALAPVRLDRHRDFGHLHERKHALLHASAAGDADDDDRKPSLSREFKAASDALALGTAE